jgi:hypothetical protein
LRLNFLTFQLQNILEILISLRHDTLLLCDTHDICLLDGSLLSSV